MRRAAVRVAVALAGCTAPLQGQSYLYRSEAFALTDTSVIQAAREPAASSEAISAKGR